MNRYELAPECLDDLEQIVGNAIEFRGSAAAQELQEKLLAAFQGLADLPGFGHRRPDLTSRPVFFYLVDPYFIVYGRDEDPLPILAVVHTSRHIRKLLKKRL